MSSLAKSPPKQLIDAPESSKPYAVRSNKRTGKNGGSLVSIGTEKIYFNPGRQVLIFCQKDLILLELRDLNLSKGGLRQNFGFGMSGKFLTLQCSKELPLLSGTSGIICGATNGTSTFNRSSLTGCERHSKFSVVRQLRSAGLGVFCTLCTIRFVSVICFTAVTKKSFIG